MSDGKSGLWGSDTLVNVLDSLGQTYVQSEAINNLADPQYVQAQNAGVQQQTNQPTQPILNNNVLLIGGAVLAVVAMIVVLK